jgi:hypothetical protein
MWLQYGLDQDGTLVCVDDVPRGKTTLKCPYCSSELIAKKGKVKEHHFAHKGDTCLPIQHREFPVIPLYNNFNVNLSSKDLAQLKLLWQEYGVNNYLISSDLVSPGLLKADLLRKNIYTVPIGYEFTNLGKIPVGALEFMLFNEVQEPLLLKKLLKLELAVEHAQHKNALDLSHRFTDLILYRTQLKRILSSTLYFLQIQTNQGTLHKIGVTQRSVEERILEIERDLLIHYEKAGEQGAGSRGEKSPTRGEVSTKGEKEQGSFHPQGVRFVPPVPLPPASYQTVAIDILGSWAHRGNVEKYFKHRYQEFNYPIGSLTEYYKFNMQDALNVLRELQKMKAKTLSSVELDLLEKKDGSLIPCLNR